MTFQEKDKITLNEETREAKVVVSNTKESPQKQQSKGFNHYIEVVKN